jgi:hypothetical protein
MMSPLWNEQDSRWHCAVSYYLHIAIYSRLIRPISGLSWSTYSTRGIFDWYLAYYVLHVAYYGWHLASCVLHVAYYDQYLAYYVLHVAYYDQHVAYYVLSIRGILWSISGLLRFTRGILRPTPDLLYSISGLLPSHMIYYAYSCQNLPSCCQHVVCYSLRLAYYDLYLASCDLPTMLQPLSLSHNGLTYNCT